MTDKAFKDDTYYIPLSIIKGYYEHSGAILSWGDPIKRRVDLFLENGKSVQMELTDRQISELRTTLES